MKPTIYFSEFLVPSIKDFEMEPQNVRRAYLACLVSYHFADVAHVHLKRGKSLKDVRAEIADISTAFWAIEGIANMAKHIELLDKKLRVRPIIGSAHVGASAAFTDGTYGSDGTSWTDSKAVVRVRDGVDVRLGPCSDEETPLLASLGRRSDGEQQLHELCALIGSSRPN